MRVTVDSYRFEEVFHGEKSFYELVEENFNDRLQTANRYEIVEFKMEEQSENGDRRMSEPQMPIAKRTNHNTVKQNEQDIVRQFFLTGDEESWRG
ncbi:hypothetical protein KIN20_024736 [Parelaphostrongylus tenuis]|uniref:Uncharacterized protein n=1 Tax=Parelaphostrongylus tenuis TaxID=148309 RepID=A0AAD5N8H6_PARTN|nr:hypothetical protein KIN20_024736 [Parelaphostrongylus tenuis]